VTGDALRDARRRIAPRPAKDRIAEHLEACHGIRVTGLTQLDLGVYRVNRSDGPAWVARVFPAARSHDAAAGDAEILDLLAGHGFAAERPAGPEPLSAVDGQAVLVTEHVPAVPPGERREAIRASGGLRRLGEMLGELQAIMPDGALARPGGGWHHLVDGGPRDEITAAQALLDDCGDRVEAPDLRHYDTLRGELAGLDGGDGLPEAAVHPDFVLANVIASPERGMVLVDWAGAGTGPRLWPLAFLLWAEATRNLARIDLVAAGYRRRVRLEPEELRPDRLEAMMRARPAVLAAWSFCLGRRSLQDAARDAVAAREVAAAAVPRAVAALAGQAG
jgi:Ser/Thr protein kinase RdoA (MazF antagonist)